MSTTTQDFNSDAIGEWSEPTRFEVTRDRIKAYSAATNDSIAAHAEGEYAKLETRDYDGKLLVEQFMTSFVRGARAPQAIGESAPPHPFDERLRERPPDAEVSQTFDRDQTFRYAKASGDPMPIHLDDELAKSMGLPGIIIHGLCTMAFTSVALIEHACPDDPRRLRRLAVRFAKPVLPGRRSRLASGVPARALTPTRLHPRMARS